MTLPSSYKDFILALVLVTLSLGATVAVGYDLLVNGPFAWHLQRPAVLQGGAEALLLATLLASAAAINRPLALAFGGLALALYLRRHNAELCVVAGLFYVEAVLAHGRLIARRWHTSGDIHLLLGLCAWLLLCFTLSLLKLASPGILLSSLLLLGLGSLALARKKPASAEILLYCRSLPTLERALMGVLLAWFCVLAARSANVLGHDTIWYLGQGDRLLSAEGSIFDSLGLVSAVHYFPKLWETLLLPLTALDQIRPQQGLGIAMLATFLVLIWRACQSLSLNTCWCCCVVLLAGSLPAVANSSLTLKTDLISAVFLLIMALQLGLWYATRKIDHLLFAFCAAVLACSSKLIAIPYVGIACCLLLLNELYRKFRNTPGVWSPATAPGYLVASLCVLVGLGFLVRTWLLTGVPTIGPDPLVSLWSALGLDIREPAGTWNWTRPQEWGQLPSLFYEWLLAPNAMPIIRITWTGNLWAVFALVAVAAMGLGMARPTKNRSNHTALWGLAFTGLILATAWQYFSRGGDGNYFLISAAVALCLSGAALAPYLQNAPASRKAVVGVSLMVFVFHAGLSFIAAAWSPPGTRTLDTALFQAPLQPSVWREKRLVKAGLGQINAYLKERPADERLVSREFKQTAVLLPIRSEAFFSIWVMRPEITETAESFFDYADVYEIDHLLLKKPNPDDEQLQALYQLARQRKWTSLEDKGGVLLTRP